MEINTMFSESEFSVTLCGSTFHVKTDNGTRGESGGWLRIHCTDDDFTLCEQSGYCNPFLMFWKSSNATLTGVARKAALIKIVRETVAREIDSVFSFVCESIQADEPIGPELAGFLAGFSARAARTAV